MASYSHLIQAFAIPLVIIPATGFLLTGFGEVADALQVADDAGQVIDIVAVAMRTFLQIAFVYVSAVVADGVRNVESKIVSAFASGHSQQLAVLRLA